MSPSSLKFPTLAIVLALPLIAAVGPAQAQRYDTDIMTKCAQSVGQMKFEGWAADRNREMMMLACEQNGGAIPGAAEERPASLSHQQPTHHQRAQH